MAGRVSLVTGTSSGFGWHIALELARRGDVVFAGMHTPAGRNKASADELTTIARRDGLHVAVIEIDVDDDDSVRAAVHSVISTEGHIDALVNNAGFGVIGPWELTSVEQARRQMETNFFGAFRVAKAVVPHMREQGSGRIVNVSSEAGVTGVPMEAFYTASKFALEGMSQVMRFELAQFGIRVAVVYPGAFRESNFDARIVDVAAAAGGAGSYEPLARHMHAQFDRKWTTYVTGEQLASVVADVLDLDEPPFRNLAGAAPWRLRPRPFDEYEADMIEFFELEPFLGPAPGRLRK